MKPSFRNTAGHIVFLYFIIGGIWILLSDLAVEALVPDPALVTRLQIVKGIAFVLVTAAALYLILRHRLAAMEKAQKHLERFRFIVEHAGQEVYLVDKSGRIVYANRAAAESLGYSMDELTHKMLSDFDPVYGPAFEPHFEEIKKKGAIAPFETQHITRDGRMVPKEMRSVYLPIGDRELICGFGADITERKRSEDALVFEKERLAVTLRSIGDGLITTDMRGNITTMNQVAETMTGWTQEEARGKPIETVFVISAEEPGRPCVNPVEKVITSGQVQSLCQNTVLTSRDGKTYAIADSSAPITDKNNEMIGVVLVFRDITENRKLMEAAQNADKLESLGLLAGGIAHDFNNLLGGIFGFIELAKLKSADPQVTDHLDRALDTIERARALTRQLLTFAKGGDPVKKHQFLKSFIEETATFLLSGTSVSWRFDIQEDLLPGFFDENQIRQVLENIIVNACQAMPDGGALEISAKNTIARNRATASPAKNHIKISIKDNGPGIPRDILPHIFDPYFTTEPKAHGIGLTTCFSIIKRHDGFMDVESEPGKGSKFHIYLPATETKIEDADVQAHPDAGPHTAGRILVMDDEEVVRNIISEMLSAIGFTVTCTASGAEAMHFFLEETRAGTPFAGLIVDLTVPGGMGGIDIINEIRGHDPDVPVFVISGYSGDPVLAKPWEYGFTASLKKPFQLRELKDMLEAHIA